MDKIAIVTINSFNFGNRLQNYALQKTLADMGYSVETIRRTGYKWDQQGITERIKDVIRSLMRTKKALYLNFDRRFITFSRYMASQDRIDPATDDAYDYFIAGSDQVWNPHYGVVTGTVDLLVFTEGMKKISYAASFGVDTMPEDKAEMFADALRDFKAISVREESGVRIVRELADREAALVLDPVMLLKKADWDKVVKKPPRLPRRRYVFVYVLGKISESMNAYLEQCTAEKGFLKYIIYGHEEDGKSEPAGPSEFLWLIKHAELVVTDSFHAMVFSVIYHKKVAAFQREGIDMSSRIRNIAGLLGLDDNFDAQGTFYITERDDFRAMERRLDTERKISTEFLRNALAEHSV